MITSEIRYFYDPNTIDVEDIVQTFELSGEEKRTDAYYLFEKAVSTGFKLREGMVEVKTLIEQQTLNNIRIGHWEKASVEGRISDLGQRGIKVHKERWLNYFDRNMQPTDLENIPACQLEVSRVLFDNTKEKDSFCLEVSGSDRSERLKMLLEMHRKVIGHFPALRDPANCRSYPEQILKLFASN